MWEGRLQIGDKIHIRFLLTTWRFIFHRFSLLPTPTTHKGIPLSLFFFSFCPQGRERIFTCSVICRLLKNCSENWREFSSSDPSSRSNELGVIFSIPFISDNCVYLKQEISKSLKQMMWSGGQYTKEVQKTWGPRDQPPPPVILLQLCKSHFETLLVEGEKITVFRRQKVRIQSSALPFASRCNLDNLFTSLRFNFQVYKTALIMTPSSVIVLTTIGGNEYMPHA